MGAKRAFPRDRRTSGLPGPKVRPDRSGPLHVEVIAVGRELLRGELAEGNARVIARAVARRGGIVHRITVVDDLAPAIVAAVREALDRNPQLLVTSGGLGPGLDDHTLAAVAEALGLPLARSQQAREMVEQAYRRLAQAGAIDFGGMNLSREKLCQLPVGATPVPNRAGVAPGVICRLSGGAAVLCLPGLRRELEAVLDAALPLLGDLTSRLRFARRQLESPTSDESALRPMLERLAAEFDGLWVSSRPVGPGESGHRVLVTLEASAATQGDAEALADRALRRLLALASGSR